jgi:hypothetical protein
MGCSMRHCCWFLALAAAAQTTYRDPRNRFEFIYPAAFGAPSAGTNDGFADRLAAIRFSGAASFGGEAALTQGFPLLDRQAAGGLYDSITLEIFPDAQRASVLKDLPPLTPANFCDTIARPQHVSGPPLVVKVDRMRNIDPKVLRCDVAGDTVTFDKEVSWNEGGPRLHVIGAVRFLRPPYSTFQFIGIAAEAPPMAALGQIADLVKSWKPGQ